MLCHPVVKVLLNYQGSSYNGNLFLFQNGDNYLLNLASRYSLEIGTPYHEILQQLEDLRLAEWSDHAPPPPAVPTSSQLGNSLNHFTSSSSQQKSQQQQKQPNVGGASSYLPQRNYENYPLRNGNNRNVDKEPIYVPGMYQVRMNESKIWLHFYISCRGVSRGGSRGKCPGCRFKGGAKWRGKKEN